MNDSRPRRSRCPRQIFAMLAVSVWFAACHSAADTSPALELSSCEIEGVEAELDCGRLTVFEDRTVRAGRRIPIYFIRARATAPEAEPDPLVVLTGGPGDAPSRGAAGILGLWRRQLALRDVVLVDQRGTGKSAPLDCVTYDLEQEPSRFQELFDRGLFDLEAFRSCAERLGRTADLKQYTTSAIADDIDQLRQALGYEKVNLAGGSYGTRLALEYVRRHEATVRSAVLRGVAPSFGLLAETVARDFEDTLEALIAACRDDTACSGAFPDFAQDLAELLRRVREAPVPVRLENPGTGELELVELRYPQLVTALRYVLYSTQLSAALPAQVQAATEGDFEPLAANLPLLLSRLSQALAEGMWASVKCSEEVRFLNLERARELSRDTVLGTLRLDAEVEICSFWPAGDIPSDFHEPLSSDVPMLLLASELDPASPLRLAEKAAESLPNSILARLANRSHWGLGGDTCIEGLVDAFLAEPSAGDLDTSCASAFERPPFVLPDPPPRTP